MRKGALIIIIVIIICLSAYILFLKKDYSLSLKGDEDVYLLINGKYDDPKVDVLCNKKKCEKAFLVNGSFDSSKTGDYELTYSYKKTDDILVRRVHVSNFAEFFKLEYDNINPLPKIIVNITIDKNRVSKFILPDGNEDNDDVKYEILENGDYTFTIFDKYNNKMDKRITINNIKKPEPIVVESTPLPIVETPAPVITPAPVVTPIPVVTPTPTPALGKLEIHFINAGGFYDDAILIRSDKATIFMDGGRGDDAVVQYLTGVNVKKIDYVIGSHTEYDHINAQGAVINNFQVDKLLYANSILKCGCRCDSQDTSAVVRAMRKKNVPEEIPQIPSVLNVGDLTLYFIGPSELGCNKNDNSLIFILKYGNNSFMFTGDSDGKFNEVDKLLANAKSLGLPDIHVNVLKYPHHGNKYITDQSFEAIKPDIIMVPNMHADNNPSMHMRDKIKSYGITMYRQSESSTGSILLTSDGNKIDVKMGVVATDYAR